MSAGEIEKLTPLIIQATRDFRANPRDLVAVERLQTIGREWASKVHVLSGAVDEIVTPWSAAASKLALAATSGDAEELKKQVEYFLTESTLRCCIRQRPFPSLTGTLGRICLSEPAVVDKIIEEYPVFQITGRSEVKSTPWLT